MADTDTLPETIARALVNSGIASREEGERFAREMHMEREISYQMFYIHLAQRRKHWKSLPWYKRMWTRRP